MLILFPIRQKSLGCHPSFGHHAVRWLPLSMAAVLVWCGDWKWLGLGSDKFVMQAKSAARGYVWTEVNTGQCFLSGSHRTLFVWPIQNRNLSSHLTFTPTSCDDTKPTEDTHSAIPSVTGLDQAQKTGWASAPRLVRTCIPAAEAASLCCMASPDAYRHGPVNSQTQSRSSSSGVPSVGPSRGPITGAGCYQKISVISHPHPLAVLWYSQIWSCSQAVNGRHMEK